MESNSRSSQISVPFVLISLSGIAWLFTILSGIVNQALRLARF